METPEALIVGVTGMIGLSLIEALQKPTALGGPWKIYGTARRTRPDWFPAIQLDGYLEFDLLDFEATRRELSHVRNKITHVFWITSQISTVEEDNFRANSAMAHEGSPFRYPGTRFTWEHFCDATDAMVLAEQQIWAAGTDAAKNQAFNCTNGDVFTWKTFWKVLCEIFDVEFVPFDENEKFDWVGLMKEKGRIWDTIVEENGLYETKLDEISCFGACQMVLNFEIQHVCSMTKSREFGFFGFVDTMKSVEKWVERLREMNIVPKT